MKKGIAAAVLLLIMLIASLWNIRYVDRFTNELEQEIQTSRRLCLAKDFTGAREALNRAMARWEGERTYTRVIIRHAEIDSVSDAFFEVMILLDSRDRAAAEGAYGRLLEHVKSIDEMEQITLGSVF